MITAASNSRVKRLVQLNQKAKLRREENVFLAEGAKMFLEAPAEKLREVYVSESFLAKCSFRERLEQTGYEVVSDAVFARISDTCTPQGILCVLEQFHYQPEELFRKKAPLLLFLENIQDPGNLGTMLRTGEGAGVDGVIMSGDTVDLYNPKVIRSTMGSVYRVPFFYAADFKEAVCRAKAAGVSVYAAHLRGKDSYGQQDYRSGTGFLIGNEGNGLREETAALADTYIRIPMEGRVESLNAAVAAAVLMYEAHRQRSR
ncbi:MAG: RNA methyltransferase [Eubacteriales bacterium]|nr:RNA methyltransferase [Eubacteriales bacterium]